MRYYLDAAPVIYAVEEVPPYAAAVDARLSATDAVRVVRDLTRMECRVKPTQSTKTPRVNGGDSRVQTIRLRATL